MIELPILPILQIRLKPLILLGLASILISPGVAMASSGSDEAAPKESREDMLDKIDEEIKDGKDTQEITDEALDDIDGMLTGVPGSGAIYRYKLGPELRGFDLSVLRSTMRLEAHRYEMGELVATSSLSAARHVRFQCVLEFGNESGLAEVERSHDVYAGMITDMIGRMDEKELRTTAGKLELKEAIIRESNRRLKTARMRQVYFTYFTLTPIKSLNNV